MVSDITSDFIEAGTNDESNSIINPFLYRNIGASWTGYLDNSTIENKIGAAGFNIPAGTSYIVIAEGVGVAARLLLRGAIYIQCDEYKFDWVCPSDIPIFQKINEQLEQYQITQLIGY